MSEQFKKGDMLVWQLADLPPRLVEFVERYLDNRAPESSCKVRDVDNRMIYVYDYELRPATAQDLLVLA